MPVKRGHDSNGPFYQWGSQHRYHYTAGDSVSRTEAKNAAERQGKVIVRKNKFSG